jgi:hypothetical protein
MAATNKAPTTETTQAPADTTAPTTASALIAASTSSTVTVGCKLPSGLVLELDGKTVELNGANSSNIIGGYGLTEGVDAEFFKQWMEKHEGMAFVRNELVFAQAKTADAKAEAVEKSAEQTGLEALNPDALPKGIEAVTQK